MSGVGTTATPSAAVPPTFTFIDSSNGVPVDAEGMENDGSHKTSLIWKPRGVRYRTMVCSHHGVMV